MYFLSKSLRLLLIISFLVTPLVSSAFIFPRVPQYFPEAEDPTPIVRESAMTYLEQLLGTEYVQNRLTLSESLLDDSGYPDNLWRLRFLVDAPDSVVIDMYLDGEGKVLEYQGIKKPYAFKITREQALEIAGSAGVKNPSSADIGFVDKLFKPNFYPLVVRKVIDDYVWVVENPFQSGVSVEVQTAYIDVDTGEVRDLKVELVNIVESGTRGPSSPSSPTTETLSSLAKSLSWPWYAGGILLLAVTLWLILKRRG